MIRKILSLDDVKAELCRYFAVMAAIPYPKRPDYAKNFLWAQMKPEDSVAYSDDSRFFITGEDIADCWFVDANWIPLLSKFEYELLKSRLKDKPCPWKVLENKYKLSRQMMNLYQQKALKRILSKIKNSKNNVIFNKS